MLQAMWQRKQEYANVTNLNDITSVNVVNNRMCHPDMISKRALELWKGQELRGCEKVSG